MSRRLFFGVGTLDVDYNVIKYFPRQKGKQKIEWVCPYYSKWRSLLKRCYSGLYKQKYPTYQDCLVCEEWLLFSNFKSWMEQQDWEGKELDKDLLIEGNKIYSPETCVFISQEINKFLIKSDAARGEYPLGVYMPKKGKLFEGRCRKGQGVRVNSRFPTAQEAHRFWQENKIEYGMYLANQETNIKVKDALLKRVENILKDYSNNDETKFF